MRASAGFGLGFSRSCLSNAALIVSARLGRTRRLGRPFGGLIADRRRRTNRMGIDSNFLSGRYSRHIGRRRRRICNI